jgi:hypothetical protein
MMDIFRYASLVKGADNPAQPKQIEACAHDLLLTLADRRFCSLIVDRVPGLALQCFEIATVYQAAPFGPFARNIGTEFVLNTESGFYQEESGYQSGYFGYAKPITKTIFGSYELVERCAADYAFPLDLHYEIIENLSPSQLEGFLRGVLAFFDDYLNQTQGKSHSYALARALGSLKSCIRTLYKLDSISSIDLRTSDEYRKLTAIMRFVVACIKTIDDYGVKPILRKPRKEIFDDPYGAISSLIYEIILSSAYVSTPENVSWHIQHNGVWGEIFSFDKSFAMKVVRFRIRRLLFDQIKELDQSPNFVGAHILGFCLNVLV